MVRGAELNEMNCLSRELISAYADGELDRRERARVEEHLGQCPACREFFDELRELGTALKHQWHREETARLKETPVCPDDETIAAFAAGTLRDAKERDRIAAHINECSRCAVRAAEKIEAAELVKEASTEKPEPVPAHVAELARKIFARREPLQIGGITAKWSELWDKFTRWLERGGAEFAVGRGGAMSMDATVCSTSILEDRPEGDEYEMMRFMSKFPPETKKPSRKVRKPGTRKPAAHKVLERVFERSAMKVRVSLYAMRPCDMECRITLTGPENRPVRGIQIELSRGGKILGVAETDARGSVRFPGIEIGRHTFLVRREGGISFDLALE